MTGFLGEEFKVRSYGSDVNVIFSRITAVNHKGWFSVHLIWFL